MTIPIPAVVAPAGLFVRVSRIDDAVDAGQVAALAGWLADGEPLVVDPERGYCMTVMEFVSWAGHAPEGDTWTVSIGPWDGVARHYEVT